ncbi:MAG: hypothetical protein H6619_04725 [Deltaproteobacteria bacterium]|nr:hypothetical protein [Deltaproteobacteria bacterium]
METGALPVLNRLLVQLDEKNGARALGNDMLSAMITTIDQFAGEKDSKSLLKQLLDLHNLLLACRPRMAHAIHDIQDLMIYLVNRPDADSNQLKNYIIELQKKNEKELEDTLKNALPLFKEQKEILIHSHSNTIQRLLAYLEHADKKPVVYVAAQDTDKTEKIIKDLHKGQFVFHVLSEYSIVHVIENLDLAIFGALTLNNNEEIILGPGSGGLIAQLKKAGIEIYSILSRSKFSYWREQTETAYSEVRSKSAMGVKYQKTVYSHDVVPLDHFTGIIADEKIYTPDEARKVYEEEQQSFVKNEEIINSINK